MPGISLRNLVLGQTFVFVGALRYLLVLTAIKFFRFFK